MLKLPSEKKEEDGTSVCEKLDRVNNCVIRRDLSLTFLPLLGFSDVFKGR